jgi:tetratricopeptide (TPR) repeat protein
VEGFQAETTEGTHVKNFNTKLFVYLIGAVVLTGTGLFLIHYFQSGRIANALLWQAKRAEEKGDLYKTAHFLKRYLEFEPNDLDERANLGRILADPKMARSNRARENALFVLEQVVARDPERNDLRRPLVRIATELGQFDLARKHLDILEKVFPSDGEVQFLLGGWHEAQTKYKPAELCFRKACELSPKNPDYLVHLADLLHQKLDRPEQAREVVNRARKLAPDEPNVLLLAATLAQGRGPLDTKAYEEARGYLERGRKLYAQNPDFIQALARLEVRQDRREQAIAILRQGLKSLPSQAHPNLHWTLANLLLDGNEQDKAEKEIALLRKASAAPAAVDYLQARLCLCREQWARAARMLERVRPRLGGSGELTAQIDLYLGQCYVQLDEPLRRRGAFKSAAERDPQSPAALLGQGAAELALGHFEEALDCYRRASQAPEAPLGAWTEYAGLLITRNRQHETPNWPEVMEALDRAENAFPKAIEIPLLRADAYAAQNNFKDAEKVLLRGKDSHPRDVKFWMALIALADNQGETDKAQRLLRDADAKLGDKVELRLGWARHLVQRDGIAAARALAALAAKRAQFDAQGQSDLLRGLAEIYYRIGEVKEAARLMNQAADLGIHRNDLRIRLRLFDLYLQAEDDAGLEKVLAQMRRLEGEEGTWWRYGQASRLLWRVRKGSPRREQLLDEASKLLDAVALQRPVWSAVPLARAEIEDLRGNTREAQRFYQSAHELGERDQRVIRQLVQLGQGLAARGERSTEAEQKLRLAVEVAGTVPETWISLVQYLVATGQIKEAEASVDRLESSGGRGFKSEEAALALGQCYESIGKVDKAREKFEGALSRSSNDLGVVRAAAGFYMRQGNAPEAKQLLERIVNQKNPPLAEGDMAWARRGLALILATGGGYQGFLDALRLLGMRLRPDGTVVEEGRDLPQDRDENLRLRARVLATQRTKALRTRAIALLEDLGRRRRLPADDQFLLAQLVEANGDWPRAQKLMRELVSRQVSNPYYMTYLAQNLVLRGKLKDAQQYIDRLVQVEKARRVKPGTFGSIELRARVLEAAGDHARAHKLLEAYAAEEPVRTEKILAFAGYLARSKRLTEALDQCDRAWKIGPPEAIGGATVALLRTAQPSAKEIARVETMINAALKDNPKSILLQVQMADLQDLQGNFDRAETLYRAILKQDENNIMALNNLAWLLAQQKKKAREAKELIDRAIALLGPRAELLDTRAVVSLALGKSDEARVDLEQAIADYPSPSRYFHLARALVMARKKAEARDKLKKAREIGLDLKRLHPLERTAYRNIEGELKSR